MKRYIRTVRVSEQNRDKLTDHQRKIVDAANRCIRKYSTAMKVLAQ